MTCLNFPTFKRHHAVLSFVFSAIVFPGFFVGCGGGSGSASAENIGNPSPSNQIGPQTPSPGSDNPTTPPASVLSPLAGDLAQRLGLPRQFLVGLGGTEPVETVKAQGIKPNIYDFYLNGLGTYMHSWDKWDSPPGAFVGLHAARADDLGAIPMFTLYQMATWGDGNLYGLKDETFMTNYWDNVRLLFNQVKKYGKPTLINFEPDFWGYSQYDRAYTGSKDPEQQLAWVKTVNPDCADMPDTVAGIGNCFLKMARAQAPNAFVGFPPSMTWAIPIADEIAYMKKVGADKADFVVMQTLDRDAGCFEAAYTEENALCTRPSDQPYWWQADNKTSPNFAEHFAVARQFHEGLGLPLLWWQTPLGVPSDQPGGTKGAFRDNRVQYFLSNPQELVAAGGMGVVFGEGQSTQTTINSDGGQFKRLSNSYFAKPMPLP